MPAQSTLATPSSVQQTIDALTAHHFIPHQVADSAAALALITTLIPSDASVMNGSSRTLDEIGFVDFLKSGQHGWKNLHAAILASTDPAEQQVLRQQALFADWYLGSVHALTETGEMLIASNTGSQLPHLVHTTKNIILVIGSQKIVPDLQAAIVRLNDIVIPLENARIQAQYGVDTVHSKSLIMHRENPHLGRQVHVVIVNQALGF